jgi:hypothetical protein
VDCPPPADLPSDASHGLRACAREVATGLQVVDAARIAIDTWRTHVHAMNMFRSGKMSASMANHRWLAMWQQGQREIDTYRAAVHAARTVSGCASTAPSASESRSS